MKLNCIIDTCSCVNLSNSEFRQKSLLYYLNNKASLNYSREVHLELRDHKDKNLPHFIYANGRALSVQKNSIPEYERRMMGTTLVSRKKKGNKGEINNLIVSIDQIHHVKKNSIVLISDDDNGTVSDWVDSFPLIKTWTSFDVVLYLYAEKIIPSKDIAFEMIRGIISFTSPPVANRSPKTTEKVTRILSTYTKRIENINKILK